MNKVFETNLYKKMLSLSSEVGSLECDKYSSQGYPYVSEGLITSKIREAAIKSNLVFTGPVKSELLKFENFTTSNEVKMFQAIVKNTYRIIDIESGEYLDIEMHGEGTDSLDKAISAACASAYKYAEKQAFMISTKREGNEGSNYSSRNGDLLTEGQKNHILNIIKRSSLDDTYVKNLCKEKYKANKFDDLSKTEASEFIKTLYELEKQKGK